MLRVGVVVVFLALTTARAYPLNQEPGHIGELESALRSASVLIYPLVGLLIGRWWAAPLVFLPVLIAIPAGPELTDNDQPAMWFQLLGLMVFFGAPITVAGIALRRGD